MTRAGDARARRRVGDAFGERRREVPRAAQKERAHRRAVRFESEVLEERARHERRHHRARVADGTRDAPIDQRGERDLQHGIAFAFGFGFGFAFAFGFGVARLPRLRGAVRKITLPRIFFALRGGVQGIGVDSLARVFFFDALRAGRRNEAFPLRDGDRDRESRRRRRRRGERDFVEGRPRQRGV